MSDARYMLSRQWVAMAGGSCDVRMGPGAIGQAEPMLKGAVGRPRACMAVVSGDVASTYRDTLSRQLAASGFEVFWHEVDERCACTLDEVSRLAQGLCAHQLTSDDLCCALGGSGVLSLASCVSGSWCEGMSLVAIPTSPGAFLEGALCPRGIDVADRRGMLGVRPAASHVLLDYDLVCGDQKTEDATYARILMVAAAMCSSERGFSALWDSVDELMGPDDDPFVQHLLAAAKSRGKILSSTAAAIRQSIAYGQGFAAALGMLTGDELAPSTRLAEGMRFSARLAVALGKLSVDDMLAQDELLEAVGSGVAACDVDPLALKEAIRSERFARTNRFMLPVPFGLGRVRFVTVSDDMLLEHTRAWCGAHGSND
ncbi:MAG: 3-dehydroquinate synthase [Coriobacteriales bacterium]|nr:3-dehydroquinate synthase [Coriobacteriales bacterium]